VTVQTPPQAASEEIQALRPKNSEVWLSRLEALLRLAERAQADPVGCDQP